MQNFESLNIKPLVAKTPVYPRDSSRLMVVCRKTEKIEHKIFRDILNYLNEGDCLVLNNSKVFPAKLMGRKSSGGKFELLLISKLENNKWLCLTPDCRTGMEVIFSGDVKAKVLKKTDEGYWVFEFTTDDVSGYALKYGVMPLPPYIEKARKKSGSEITTPQDIYDYQTVYANKYGSVAAPTAGFHFTEELLEKIKQKGVKIVFVTLHIGWGTFKPLKTPPEKHKMLAELAEISKENADIINTVEKSGGKVFAVGTTATRTLEGFARKAGIVDFGKKWVDLFIYPPYNFKIIDCLITNFHLPRHTPIYLTAAFVGRKLLFEAYKKAVAKKYRFYSYGDAMLVI